MTACIAACRPHRVRSCSQTVSNTSMQIEMSWAAALAPRRDRSKPHSEKFSPNKALMAAISGHYPIYDLSGRCSAGRPGLRCRLVPQCADRNGDFSVRPVKDQPHSSNPTRSGTLSLAPQDREHIRAPQGPAQGRDALRSMPDPFPLGMRPHRHRHLLVMSLDRRINKKTPI